MPCVCKEVTVRNLPTVFRGDKTLLATHKTDLEVLDTPNVDVRQPSSTQCQTQLQDLNNT
jgi:hypothetical protein